MKTFFGRIMLVCFISLLPTLAQAKNYFDNFNVTGSKHSFSQHEDDLYWEGGLINYLKEGRVISDAPRSPLFPKYKIHYMKWVPANSNGHVIIYNSGLQSHAEWFYETAEKLSVLGYTIYAFDRIGSGYSGDGISIVPASETSDGVAHLNRGSGHVANWKAYTKTIHLMKQIAKTQNPGKTLHIWANSFAANIVTAYLLQYEPADVASYVFTSPGLFSKLPLPFAIPDLISAAPGTYFPSTIPSLNGDQGAYLFTSIPAYARAITKDRKSLRNFTKEFYFNVVALQNYHFGKSAAPNSFLLQTRRFYLVVDGDPMMNTAQTMNYIHQYSANAVAKRYSGGTDHRHFLEFTDDVEIALLDIDAFFLGQPVIGNEIE